MSLYNVNESLLLDCVLSSSSLCYNILTSPFISFVCEYFSYHNHLLHKQSLHGLGLRRTCPDLVLTFRSDCLSSDNSTSCFVLFDLL